MGWSSSSGGGAAPAVGVVQSAAQKFIPHTDGRFSYSNTGHSDWQTFNFGQALVGSWRYGQGGSRNMAHISFQTNSQFLHLVMNDGYRPYVEVLVDGARIGMFDTLDATLRHPITGFADSYIVLFTGQNPLGSYRQIDIYVTSNYLGSPGGRSYEFYFSGVYVSQDADLAPPRVTTKRRRMVCYGDSITEAQTISGPSKSWLMMLGAMLDVETINQGEYGSMLYNGTDTQILDRCQQRVSAFTPDLVWILYGTNDATGSATQAQFEHAYDITLQKIFTDLPNALVVMCTLPYRQNQDNTAFNALITKIAQRYNLPLMLWDTVITASNYTTTLADGTHPNDVGNGLLAHYSVGAIDPYFNRATGGGSGAVCHRTVTPASQAYPVGVTSLQTNRPSGGRYTLVPSSWTLPGKLGNVEPGVRFFFTDGTSVTRKNTTAGALTETREAVQFQKDNVRVLYAEFIGDNVSAAAETQALGAFRFEGHQL